MDPIQAIAEWLRGLLLGWGASASLTEVVLKFLGALLVGGGIMVVFIVLTWVERKGAARFQDRIGPNRVGPFGLIQPIADALKMLTKEDTIPQGADRFTFNLAPIMAVFSVLMAWAVIPFWKGAIGADLNVGILYIAAVGSFGVISVMLAGWSSNNKYSLLGAFRGVAQLISYEVPLFLALLVPVFLSRSMGVNAIVEAQDGVWYVFMVPLIAIIYYISALAEVGRAPFDLLEAESEIVAGYHVEYSGIKFGLFQAAEFLHSFTFAALMSILFFGGWRFFGLEKYWIVGLLAFLGKTAFFYGIIIWTRMTFPRVRIDQLMDLNWKFMVPTSLIFLMVLPILEYIIKVNALGTAARVGILLGFNLLMIFGLSLVLIQQNRRHKLEKRRTRFELRPLAVMPAAPEATEEEAA